MKEIILMLIAGIVFLMLAIMLNAWANSKAMANCEAKGGTFSYAIDAGKSLCTLPHKDNK